MSAGIFRKFDELDSTRSTEAAQELLLTSEHDCGLRTVRSKMRLINRISQDLSPLPLYQSENPYNLSLMQQTLANRLRDHYVNELNFDSFAAQPLSERVARSVRLAESEATHRLEQHHNLPAIPNPLMTIR